MASNVMKQSENMLHPTIPVLKSKSRILSTVTNKDAKINCISNTINKSALIERQRENASKLSSGLSVVAKADKENDVTFKKPTKVNPKLQQKTKKPLEQKKVNIQKSDSVLSLYHQEVIKGTGKISVRKQEIPILRDKKVSLKNDTKSRSITSVVKDKNETAEVQQEEKEEVKGEVDSEEEDKVPPNVIDVDEELKNDEYILGIYAKDIYRFLRHLETVQNIRENYLTKAHIMTQHMRAVLVDWIFEIQQSFRLLNETVQLAIALLDRFMQDHPSIVKDELQLVAVACIFLASKYEEIFPPDLMDLMDVSVHTYTKQQILKMEQMIFSALKFQIGRPLPSQFLRRFGRVSKVDGITYCFSKYFIDLSLVNYALCHIQPSLLAAASLYLSLYLTSDDQEKEFWTPSLVYYSKYSSENLKPVVTKIASLVLQAPNSKYQTVHKKYLDPRKLSNVSSRSEMMTDKLSKIISDRETRL